MLALAPPDEDQLPSGNRLIRMVRVLRFLKLARILRVGKIGVFMEAFEQELVGSSWSMLLFAISKIIVFLMFVAHIGGCFWYMVGISNQDKYGASWLTEKMPGYNVEPWFVRSTNYLWSVHFAMATMTTVGSVSYTHLTLPTILRV